MAESVCYLRGSFGNSLVAEEAIKLSETSTWKGTRLYSELVYCNLKINFPTFNSIIIPQMSTIDTNSAIDVEANYVDSLEKKIADANHFFSELENLRKIVDEKYKEVVPPQPNATSPIINVSQNPKDVSPITMNFTDKENECITLFQTITSANRCLSSFFLESAAWNLTEAYQVYSNTYMKEPSNRMMFFRITLPNGHIVRCLGAYSETVWDLYSKVYKEMEKIKMSGEIILSYNDLDWSEKVYGVRLEALGLKMDEPVSPKLRFA